MNEPRVKDGQQLTADDGLSDDHDVQPVINWLDQFNSGDDAIRCPTDGAPAGIIYENIRRAAENTRDDYPPPWNLFLTDWTVSDDRLDVTFYKDNTLALVAVEEDETTVERQMETIDRSEVQARDPTPQSGERYKHLVRTVEGDTETFALVDTEKGDFVIASGDRRQAATSDTEHRLDVLQRGGIRGDIRSIDSMPLTVGELVDLLQSGGYDLNISDRGTTLHISWRDISQLRRPERVRAADGETTNIDLLFEPVFHQ